MGSIVSRLRSLPADANESPENRETFIVRYAKWFQYFERVMFVVLEVAPVMLPKKSAPTSQNPNLEAFVHQLARSVGKLSGLSLLLEETNARIVVCALAFPCAAIGFYSRMYRATENMSPIVNPGENSNVNLDENPNPNVNTKAYEVLSQEQQVAFDRKVREMADPELGVLRDFTSLLIQEAPRNSATERSPHVEMTPITGGNHILQGISMSQTSPDELAGQMIDLVRGTSEAGPAENIEEVRNAIYHFNRSNETSFEARVEAINAKIIEKRAGLRRKYICRNFHRQMLTSWEPWKAALWSLDNLELLAELITLILSIRERRKPI